MLWLTINLCKSHNWQTKVLMLILFYVYMQIEMVSPCSSCTDTSIWLSFRNLDFLVSMDIICWYIIYIHLRKKTSSPCLHSLVKTEVNVWENSTADQWKPETQSRVFTSSRILTNVAEVFNRLWKHGEHVLFLL